jgi:hypothetical protein
MSASLPTTYLEWEAVLTRHFLSIGEGDASPLRSFEVTDLTLTEAAGFEDEAKDRVVEAFRLAMIDKKQNLVSAFQHGEYRKYSGDEIPGCFGYLALTMLVESMIDPETSGHEFRPKLKAFLKIDRTFSNLPGINLMWKDLEKWLKVRSLTGLPFRLLELPPEELWRNQIGYSVRLSFPSRRDKVVVQHFLDENEGILASPSEFLGRFRRVADSSKSTVYLKSAFEDFRQSYLKKQRALSDHRFWRLVQAISLGRKASKSVEILLETARDEDNLWSFSVSDSLTGRCIGNYASLDKAVAACAANENHELLRAIDLGVIFFRQTGHARWEAMPILANGLKRVMVGLSPRLTGKVGKKLGTLETSGEWSLSGSVPAGTAQDCLAAFVKLPDPEEQIRTIRVFGGVRSAGEWLGRPRFLPKVAADTFELAIAPRGGTNDGTLYCREELAGVHAIRSALPLDGPYVVQPAEIDDTSPPWSRNLTFVRDAHVHQTFPAPKGKRIAEWQDTAANSMETTSAVDAWNDIDPELDDLIEAIYAGGSSGWNEAEIVPIMSDILGDEASPWDMLRALQEATMLEPYLKPGWKGRTWTLRRPIVASLQSRCGPLVVVDGYAGTRQIQDFRVAVDAMGGAAFRQPGTGKWSAPLIGARDVDPTELATRLGWSVGLTPTAGGLPASFIQTVISPEFYISASHWSWKHGHFTTRRDDHGEQVQLARYMNKGQRDHDVYVVSFDGKTAKFVSRQAAIAHAHVQRRTPIFEVQGDRLVRLTKEGALPMPIAAWLRYRNLSNPGTSARRHYAYPARTSDLGKLRALLPAVIRAETPQSVFEAANVFRRSGGAARLLWLNNGMRAARVSPPIG